MNTTAKPTIGSAELLAIGSELLAGETRDTNSGDIASHLTDLGVEVARMTQLPDDRAIIAEAVSAALGRADLVVTTGGLGPTPDDLTREGIADALGQTPSVDSDIEAWLRDLWARRDLPFSNANLKQAWLIPGAAPLDNPNGTAPGWWVDHEAQVVVALPGPPRELEPMWRDQVAPRLARHGVGLDRFVRTLRLTGIGESAVVDLVGVDLLEHPNPRLATYARPDSVDLRVSAVNTLGRSAREMVQEAIASLSPRIDPFVFAYDEESWPEALGRRLAGRRMASIEHGTGGYVGMLLGSAPFLAHAEMEHDLVADVATLAADVRARTGSDIGMAAVARESSDDMQLDVAIDMDGQRWQARHSIFRGGDAGRRRSANAAVAELWRHLADASSSGRPPLAG